MLRAIETALADYSARTQQLARIAQQTNRPDTDDVANTVARMVNQRAAEADLTVAKVADETEASLMHVIA